MSDDHIGVKVNGVIYVKLEDARKLREGWDKADDRIAELEAALRAIKHLALTTHQLSKYRVDYLRIIDTALEGKKDG